MQHRINYTAGFGIQTGDYEEFRDASNNVMRRLHYINSPYGLVAVVEKTPSSQYNTRYITTDYLGSIVCITDDAGNVLQQVSFDAWGRRRNPQTWALYQANAPLTPTPSALYFDRGYTGHEHLEKFDLINMNGRMYDPTLCRMLSVDNYNNNVSSTIGMNRYAYVGNNPLKYYEEDGHIWHIVIGAVVGGVVNLATNWNNVDNFWEGLAAFGVGAGAGALTTTTGGATAGFFATTGAAIGAAAVGGAATGFTNNVIAQTGNGVGLNGVNWGQAGMGAAVGGVAGVASYGASSWATNNLGGTLISSFKIPEHTIGSGLVNGFVGGAAGGAAGGFTAGFLFSGGNVDAGLQGAWSGFKTGIAMGGAMGAGSGYLDARSRGINPITGQPNRVNDFDFTSGSQRAFDNPDRTVPRETISKGIVEGAKYPDFQSNNQDIAVFYSRQVINGKVYNLKVVYNPTTNQVYHFHYQSQSFTTPSYKLIINKIQR